MEPRSECEALIVGAGPVGMSAAAFLARDGIRTQILEEGYRPAARSYALALHPGTLALLDEIGLAEPLIDKGQKVETIAFYDGTERRLELDVGAVRTRFPFVLVLAQSQLEETLSRHLRRSNVPVLWNHRASRFGGLDRGLIKIESERMAYESAGYGLSRSRTAFDQPAAIHAFFVIGAGGYRSVVRRALGFDYREMAPVKTYGIFEFQATDSKSPWDARPEVHVVLEGETASVLWPLGNGRFRWSFELKDEENASPRLKRRLLMQMGEEAFPYVAQDLLEDLVQERAPWFDATPQEVSWSVALRFEHKLAESFGRGGAWLAGDAAHLAPPIGVHSMNVGIKEAWALTRRLDGILRNGESRDALEEYGAAQLAEWEMIFDPQSCLAGSNDDGWQRANARRILGSIPASGLELRQLAAQAGFDLQIPEPALAESGNAVLGAI